MTVDDRTLVSSFYAFALLLWAEPVIGALSQAWPIALQSPNWRWGLIGVMAWDGVPLVMSAVLALWVATSLGHRTASRWLGRLAVALSVVCTLAILLFFYDGLRIRSISTAETLQYFSQAMVRVSLTLVVGAITLFLGGRAALRGVRLAHDASSGDE